MSIRATFHYFQGMECDMYSFYRIPKLLFTSEYFKNLSCEAKVLYGLMLDRMSLSIKNRWFDEEDRAYIFFSVEEIMEMLNCGRNKAVNCLKELDQEKGIGLIEKRRRYCITLLQQSISFMMLKFDMTCTGGRIFQTGKNFVPTGHEV